jgi:catechol 2,3-dioxygenase-like lactoylglutathione lyase family enzyme
MMKLDHLRIPVIDLGRSRDWYTKTLGQVPDVDATFAEWSARGVEFAHGPRKSYWGLRRGICGGPPGNSSGQLPRGRGDGQLSDNPFGREWRNWQTRWT